MTPISRSGLLLITLGPELGVAVMADLCPRATREAYVSMECERLDFHGSAVIVDDDTAFTRGRLWSLGPNCEARLDAFHGYPARADKIRTTVRMGERGCRPAIRYQARNPGPLRPPSAREIALMRQGYRDFGIPESQLDDALARARRGLLAA